MSRDVEFLNYIAQNAKMGIDTLTVILKDIEGRDFKKILLEQLEEYMKVYDKCSEILHDMNTEYKDFSVFQKASTYMATKLNIAKDDSHSHIAEMIIQGSTMGVTDITKKINEYSEVDEKVQLIANKLLKIEENNIEEMKKYL
ncbi:MAG: hypothetical protein N2749_03810 [Clostridia bacterium]|nr:hypothetical protein [Clostridia bacterium]